ncbi:MULTISPECIES: AzlD domain-containing protein [unclassified Roseateles]|uniref:AzlD domain-containing protein n=1 Tax=unclassified Roseateles TaxID=2626991 RepID=UPI0006F41AC7|nr:MULTISPECIES: AzlD domain-containing protein [unclassified Roseateles]KQW51296.1 branched-chain amino acid transporter [Pelomonas sp. Root405]KRA77528.1 branched-chain amino acid transporter [Pelomonas sp. Root662]
MPEWLIWIALFGLGAITVVTRGFFMIGDRQLPIPDWLRELLKVAPLAALVAVVAPEVFMTQGQVITTWQDARWPAAVVATGYFFWRRDILGTIVSGMVVMLTLKLGLGW